MGFFQRFMYGRYGGDQLNVFLLCLGLVLYLLSQLLRAPLLSLLYMAVMVAALYRTLSRNIPKRRSENAKFLSLFAPVLRWFRLRKAILKDKDHRYFKCPNCHQQLRAPRGKGKISVTCRNCGVSFEEKT